LFIFIFLLVFYYLLLLFFKQANSITFFMFVMTYRLLSSQPKNNCQLVVVFIFKKENQLKENSLWYLVQDCRAHRLSGNLIWIFQINSSISKPFLFSPLQIWQSKWEILNAHTYVYYFDKYAWRNSVIYMLEICPFFMSKTVFMGSLCTRQWESGHVSECFNKLKCIVSAVEGFPMV